MNSCAFPPSIAVAAVGLSRSAIISGSSTKYLILMNGEPETKCNVLGALLSREMQTTYFFFLITTLFLRSSPRNHFVLITTRGYFFFIFWFYNLIQNVFAEITYTILNYKPRPPPPFHPLPPQTYGNSAIFYNRLKIKAYGEISVSAHETSR